jgi:hypothetical protein
VIVGSSSCGYILRWAIPYPDAKDIHNIEYSYSHQLRSPYPVVYLNLCPDKTTSLYRTLLYPSTMDIRANKACKVGLNSQIREDCTAIYMCVFACNV